MITIRGETIEKVSDINHMIVLLNCILKIFCYQVFYYSSFSGGHRAGKETIEDELMLH